MNRARRALLLFLTMGAMVGLLALSLAHVDWGRAREAFRSAHWAYLPVAALFGLAVFPVKAYRWRIILGNGARPRLGTLYSAIMIGFMVNCIFSRVGEVVRAVVLGAKSEVRTSTALASIALERVFDMMVVLLFLVTSLLWLQPQGAGEGGRALARLRLVGALGTVMFAAGVTFLVLLRLRPQVALRVAHSASGWLPQRVRGHVERFLAKFLEGLVALRSWRQLAFVTALSFVHWSLQVLFFLMAGYCFPDLGLSVPGAMLVFAVSALGVGALPTPGYLGVFTGTIEAAGAIMGLPGPLMFSYAWVCWGANIPLIVAIGLACMWLQGLSARALRDTSTAR